MKIMKGCAVIFILSLFIFGCFPLNQPKEMDTFDLSASVVENAYFKVTINPGDINQSTFLHNNMELVIQNKTQEDLKLIWNETLYVFNNQTEGAFMFFNETYATRNDPKPIDIIFPKQIYRKIIFPNALVGFSRGWYSSALPPGQNGIYLTIDVGGKKVSEKVFMTVSRAIYQKHHGKPGAKAATSEQINPESNDIAPEQINSGSKITLPKQTNQGSKATMPKQE